MKFLAAAGKEIPEWIANFGKRALVDESITTRIDVAEFARLKLESLSCHATQLGPNTPFRMVPQEIWLDMAKTETLMLAESRTGRAKDETDLFEGIE